MRNLTAASEPGGAPKAGTVDSNSPSLDPGEIEALAREELNTEILSKFIFIPRLTCPLKDSKHQCNPKPQLHRCLGF